MGLPKVEFTQCTQEQLAMAIDHEKFDRVLQYRGKDVGDMDLEDFRDFCLWVAKVLCGMAVIREPEGSTPEDALPEGLNPDGANPAPEEVEPEDPPEPEKKTSGKGKK